MRGSARYGVELPFTGDALEGVGASLGEDEPRPRDKIDDRSRHENFARTGKRRNALADVDGDATYVLATQLDLPGVEAGAHLDAEGTNSCADRLRATHRPGRPIERGE